MVHGGWAPGLQSQAQGDGEGGAEMEDNQLIYLESAVY